MSNAAEIAFSDDREVPTIEPKQAQYINETFPGRVPAQGTLWRVYFPIGEVPSEVSVRVALGALNAVKVSRTAVESLADVTYDQSIDHGNLRVVHAVDPVQEVFPENVLTPNAEANIVELHPEGVPNINNESETQA